MKYQLVIQFPVTEDFDFDAIIALETRLVLEMGCDHIVDGHNFGASDINILIQTNDLEAAYEKAFDMVNTDLISTLKVAYKLNDVSDFVWLYPDNCQDNFSIK